MTLLAIPPILVDAYAGLREVDRDLIEAGRGMGLTRAEILRRHRGAAGAPGHHRRLPDGDAPGHRHRDDRRDPVRSAASAASSSTGSTRARRPVLDLRGRDPRDAARRRGGPRAGPRPAPADPRALREAAARERGGPTDPVTGSEDRSRSDGARPRHGPSDPRPQLGPSSPDTPLAGKVRGRCRPDWRHGSGGEPTCG